MSAATREGLQWPLELRMLSSLLYTFCCCCTQILLALPAALWRCLPSVVSAVKPSITSNCVFYEGSVYHVRRFPAANSFRYPTRLAVIDLDRPPPWWQHQQQAEHHTAAEARIIAGTAGSVKLLTNPASAGYSQNPISVYYCHSDTGALQKCIAVVTNTPWGASVSFLFDPWGQSIPKALHVSPFMDMRNTWHLQAPMPGAELHLSVSASHPEHGSYFHAVLTGHVSAVPYLRNEEAGLRVLVKYGFQPQRVACLIYWQAIKLLWKGVPFFSPPEVAFKQHVNERATHESDNEGHRFRWQAAKCAPWNVQQ